MRAEATRSLRGYLDMVYALYLRSCLKNVMRSKLPRSTNLIEGCSKLACPSNEKRSFYELCQ